MKASLLRSRFERALRLSLLAALPVTAACGGAVDVTHDGGTDAAPTDSGKDVVILDSGACTAIDIPANGPSCGYEVTLSGDLSQCGFVDGGQVPASVCNKLCGPLNGPPTSYCYWYSGNPGKLQCGNGCVGRRPAGLVNDGVGESPRSIVGAYLAGAAFLEAASVDAFQILHDELVHHRAPRPLRQAALRARADEVRHAQVVTDLAARWGATVAVPSVERRAPRELEAIALENAVEGCVRETWGAVLASWQATHAANPRVRASMRMIARDEAEHALLGHRIAAWIEPRLDAGARARVAAARSAAITELRAELAREHDASLRSELGLPTAAEASVLIDRLFAELGLLSAA